MEPGEPREKVVVIYTGRWREHKEGGSHSNLLRSKQSVSCTGSTSQRSQIGGHQKGARAADMGDR